MKRQRRSYRLAGWDYSNIGYYFVTICAQNRKCCLGNIHEGNVQLSEIGLLAKRFWIEIPHHFRNVRTDQFIIMPNHIHGILIINKRRDVALQRPYNEMSKISPRPGSLSTVIRSFKSVVTKTINHKFPNTNFAWQPRFHDQIIRSERFLNRVREYIQSNPLQWDLDEYHPKNRK